MLRRLFKKIAEIKSKTVTTLKPLGNTTVNAVTAAALTFGALPTETAAFDVNTILDNFEPENVITAQKDVQTFIDEIGETIEEYTETLGSPNRTLNPTFWIDDGTSISTQITKSIYNPVGKAARYLDLLPEYKNEINWLKSVLPQNLDITYDIAPIHTTSIGVNLPLLDIDLGNGWSFTPSIPTSIYAGSQTGSHILTLNDAYDLAGKVATTAASNIPETAPYADNIVPAVQDAAEKVKESVQEIVLKYPETQQYYDAAAKTLDGNQELARLDYNTLALGAKTGIHLQLEKKITEGTRINIGIEPGVSLDAIAREFDQDVLDYGNVVGDACWSTYTKLTAGFNATSENGWSYGAQAWVEQTQPRDCFMATDTRQSETNWGIAVMANKTFEKPPTAPAMDWQAVKAEPATTVYGEIMHKLADRHGGPVIMTF